MLGEATVKASRIMMVMKGDTLVYNAAAFQLSEGSMLDQLVRQLPGVELRDGGRIYVNGRYANSVDFVSEAGANGQRSSVRNLSVGETLRFDYRYGQVHVGAQARASYTRATSRRAPPFSPRSLPLSSLLRGKVDSPKRSIRPRSRSYHTVPTDWVGKCRQRS